MSAQRIARPPHTIGERDDILAAAGFDISAECEACDGEGQILNGIPGQPPLDCMNCDGVGVIPIEGDLR